MKEQLILEALQTAGIAAYSASDLAGLSGWTPETRIKAIGRTFIIPDDQKYVEFVNIPNNSNGDYWDDSRIYQGNFRIILHWKIDDQGAYPPTNYIDQIGGFFTKGKMFANGGINVKIYDVPSASGLITNDAELLFPVSLPYRCFDA